MNSVRIGDALELVYGRNLPAAKRAGGAIPVYGSNGIVGWHDTALVAEPTIVIGRKGAAGAIHLTAGPCFPIDTTFYVRVKPGFRFDLRYLAFALEMLDLTRLRIVVAVPGINRDEVYRESLPYPPIDEQRRIVNLLSRAENIVRMRWDAEAKAKEIIPALFLDMFGDPARNERGFHVRPIGELCARKPNYGTMIPGNSRAGEWLCLRVANIQEHGLSLADKKFVDLPAEAREKHEVLEGDLLLARAIGSLDHLGKCIVAAPGSQLWAFDSHLMRVRLNQSLAIPDWLTTLLRTPGGRSLFLANVRRGAVQFNVNTGEFMRIRVPVPPIQLQRAFADVAGRVRELAAQQAVATAHAKSAFQSLLHKVFGDAE